MYVGQFVLAGLESRWLLLVRFNVFSAVVNVVFECLVLSRFFHQVFQDFVRNMCILVLIGSLGDLQTPLLCVFS